MFWEQILAKIEFPALGHPVMAWKEKGCRIEQNEATLHPKEFRGYAPLGAIDVQIQITVYGIALPLFQYCNTGGHSGIVTGCLAVRWAAARTIAFAPPDCGEG
jgi:hypothetical protein